MEVIPERVNEARAERAGETLERYERLLKTEEGYAELKGGGCSVCSRPVPCLPSPCGIPEPLTLSAALHFCGWPA